MRVFSHPGYIVLAGITLTVFVFYLLTRQNKILQNNDPAKDYTAYNWKKDSPDAIMKVWRSSPALSNAVKKIVYLDYLLMFLYGLTISYGLYIAGKSSNVFWKYIFYSAIVLILTGVVCDAVQDNAIYQHLTKEKFADMRNLTQVKFGCIIVSVILLVTGMVMQRKVFF